MDLRRDDLTRIARAPAKLNLYLNVLGRRADGFHELETVMVPIRLFDTLTFLPVRTDTVGPAGDIRLDVRVAGARAQSGQEPIPTGESNLVVRALRLLHERSGCELGARVGLVKRIPTAAGLGGGSSDAAAVLRLANRGWGINWSARRLAEVAAEVGSDVAFFVMGGPAICRGRGERIEPLPTTGPMHFVVVKPLVGLSTADVYRQYAGRQANESTEQRPTLTEFVSGSLRWPHIGCGRYMWNGLERAASSLSPCVDKLRMEFEQLDFVGHQLSGSGSAYFGVCRHAQHARRLANILRTRQLGLVYATRSCQ